MKHGEPICGGMGTKWVGMGMSRRGIRNWLMNHVGVRCTHPLNDVLK